MAVVEPDWSFIELPYLPPPQTPPTIPPWVRSLCVAQLRDVMGVLGRCRDRGEFRLQTYTDYRWVQHDGDEWGFSFRRVCEILDFDPEVLRARFYELKLLGPKIATLVHDRENPPKPTRRRKPKPKKPTTRPSPKMLSLSHLRPSPLPKIKMAASG